MAIKINPKNKGKFNALKKRTGKTTEQLTHSKNPLTRKRAIFAQNAKKWKHEYGGELNFGDTLGSISQGVNMGTSIMNPIIQGIRGIKDARMQDIYSDAARDLRQVDVRKMGNLNKTFIGLLSGKKGREQAERFNEDILEQQRNKDVASRFSTMSEAPTYSPVARQGGYITKLNSEQEKTFQSWYKRTSKSLGLNINPDDPNHKYDYRGFYKEYGDVPMDSGQHFIDTYKLPGHPTFSNESKYANFGNKDLQGYWGNPILESGQGVDNYIAPGKSKLPVHRQGGFIAYKGQTHEGPDGGILVDKMGNPTGVSQEESVGIVEGGGKNKKGEVSYYEPESGSTYIYSDALGFGRPANGLLNKYKLNKPESLQYQQYKNDLLTKTMVDKKFTNLRVANEFAKETGSSAKDSMGIFKKGGELSSSKAKVMLKDGTANGKKLTTKQRKYFYWVAGGRKEEGGELDKRTVLMPKKNLEYDRDLSVNRGWMDSLKNAKNLDEVYNTPVGTWQGNPMTMKQFTELPSYATDYYNPNYAMEFNKNRLGLSNTFQDINLDTTKTGPRYTPGANYKPQNNVAYYAKGGTLPIYLDGGEEDGFTFDEKYWREAGFNTNQINRLRRNQLNKYLSGLTKEQRQARRASILNQSKSTYEPSGYATPYGSVTGTDYFGEPNTLEIQKAPIIRGPVNTPVKPGVGSGKSGPTKLNNWMTPKIGTENINLNAIDYYKEPYAINSGLAKGPTMPDGTPQGEDMNPWLNPAGHILSGVGAIADYVALGKAKPTPISTGRVGAERISLAQQRLANTRNATSARAMAGSAARSSGMNSGVALSNTLAANTGTNRLLGQQNAELLQNEENANAQMRQQANMVNAELSAQEGMFNAQRLDAYSAMRARMNPVGSLSRTAAGYFADNAAYGQQYDTMRMMSPNAELYEDPNSTFMGRLMGTSRPQIRHLDRGKFTTEELMKLLNRK